MTSARQNDRYAPSLVITRDGLVSALSSAARAQIRYSTAIASVDDSPEVGQPRHGTAYGPDAIAGGELPGPKIHVHPRIRGAASHHRRE